MLKLATVFSGIGAIEHALDRMHVDHEIVFACDNGDVELEMPKVKVDIDAIETELKVLKKKVKAFNLDFADEESVDYAAQLDVMLVGVEGELKKLLERLEVSDDELKVINEALGDVDRILKSSMDATTASKKKKYKELLEIRNDSASDKAKLFFLLRVTLTLINDEIEYDSEPLKIIAKRYEQSIKKIIKSGKDLSERLDMIYDKLFYLDANIELKQLDSYEARKKYVDSLYAGKESQNKVKKSYMANYKISEKDFHWNVAFLDGKQYEGQVDLFVGGSPCQSFSLVGKQRGLEDTRGTLFYEYARLIKEIKPKVFIYENVKANEQHQFIIFDAKYYNAHLEKGIVPTGQPGIESITKQYLYQLAYQRFIEDHKFSSVKNCFLLPTENNEIEDKGEVRMEMLSNLGLQDIKIRLIPATMAYDLYLSGSKMDMERLDL